MRTLFLNPNSSKDITAVLCRQIAATLDGPLR